VTKQLYLTLAIVGLRLVELAFGAVFGDTDVNRGRIGRRERQSQRRKERVAVYASAGLKATRF